MSNAGLGEGGYEPPAADLRDLQAMTMADRYRLVSEGAARGIPPEVTAQQFGFNQPIEPASAPEQAPQRDDLGTFGLARYGFERANEDILAGSGEMAEDFLGADRLNDTAQRLAEFVGPSEEREARAAETLMPDGQKKGILGQIKDGVIMEAPNVAAAIGAGVAAGRLAGPRGAMVGAIVGGGIGIIQAVPRIYTEAIGNIDNVNRKALSEATGRAPEDVTDDELRAARTDEQKGRALAATAPGLVAALPIGRIVSKVPGLNQMANDAALETLQRKNILLGGLKEGGYVAGLEAAQEVAENIAVDFLTDEDIREQTRATLGKGEYAEFAQWAAETLGEKYLVAAGAGAVLGGAPGTAVGISAQKAKNAIAETQTRELVGLAAQRGVTLDDIEGAIKDGKGQELARAATTLGRQQRLLEQAEAVVESAEADKAPPEAIAAAKELRDRRIKELDDATDKAGADLGITSWRTKVDADRVKKEQERTRRDAALTRLDRVGQTASKDIDLDTVERNADALERAEGRVMDLTDRVEAIADPDRQAEARTELAEAQGQLTEARVRAKEQLQGMTNAQAVRAVKADDARTEKDRRLDAQRVGRERAIERQMELEFPEGMADDARAARAQEILDEAAADQSQDKGLETKLNRLRRQRRAATSQPDIDRLTNEIADLEARRGLPTPAVEAARRVLQAQGEAVSVDGEATRPADQQPVGEARVAVEADGQVAPAPDADAGQLAEPAGLDADRDTPAVRAALDRAETAAQGGFEYEGQAFRDLTSELGSPATLAEAEDAMRAWTAETGFEVAAHIGPDGKVMAIGTNEMVDGVMPPRAGWGDMGVTFTHTHPEQTPFSGFDIRAMLQAPQPYRAVLPDGVTEMRPLKAISQAEYMAVNRGIFGAHDRILPDDMPALSRARVRQEAMIQALEAAGVIDYVRPFNNLTEVEKNYVTEIFDAVQPAIAGLRKRVDGRPGIAETGSLWGPAGERRAVDAEGGEGEAARVEFTDDADDPDTDLSAGFFDDRSSQRDKRPSFNRERVAEITNSIVEQIGGPKAPNAATAVQFWRTGKLTREGIQAGVETWLAADGMKDAFTLPQVVRATFPQFEREFDATKDTVRKEKKKGQDDEGKSYNGLTPEKLKYFDVALSLRGYASRAGFGDFTPRLNPMQSSRNRAFNTFFNRVSPELAAFVELQPPPGMRFDPPVPDPGATPKIMRDPRNNFLSEEGVEVARRTARYLQANRYKVDKAKLDALTADDLLSGKGLARDGLKKSDIDKFKALDGLSREDMSPEEWRFMGKYAKLIREKRRGADERLRKLRDAYAMFVREHGEDGDVGFMYQIDNRGRIYADGSFHPQTDKAIKRIFTHNGRNLVDDMVDVDNSASGWQVTALMARDEVAAEKLNLGRGQATEPGYTKSDLYNTVINEIRLGLERDAAMDTSTVAGIKPRRIAEGKKQLAQYFLREVFPGGAPDGWDVRRDELPATWKLNRNGIKPAIIAKNYGGTPTGMRQTLVKALTPQINGRDMPKIKGLSPWSYFSNLGEDAVKAAAPASMKMQEWAIGNLTKIIEALGKKYAYRDMPPIEITIGINGRVKVKKPRQIEIKDEASSKVRTTREIAEDDSVVDVSNKGETSVTFMLKANMDAVNAERTARAIWANLVQSYDAAILHRAVERYKRATGGDYVTTNHDSFTVPPEREGEISAAVRESMRAIMEQVNVPRQLFSEMDALNQREGLGLDIPMFDAVGNYSYDDIMSSTPLFGERPGDPRGEDFVPQYADLPEDGAELRRGTDDPGPLAQGDRAPEITPEVRRARDARIDVAQYMAGMPEAQGIVAGIRNTITNPDIAQRGFAQWLEDTGFNAFAPIRRLEEKVKGALPPGMDSAFKSAEIAINDTGRNESLLYYGAASRGQYGEFRPAPGTLGLHDIFKTATNGITNGQGLQHWFEYMAARRAKQLRGRGIVMPQTDTDIATALARETTDFIRAAKEWKNHNEANLKFLLDSGRISKEQHDAMVADEFYVPFYRSEERVDGTSPELILDQYKGGGPRGSRRGLTDTNPGIVAIKGGDKQKIENLAKNMIRNSQAMVAAAMRNDAANKTADLIVQAGLGKIIKDKAVDKKPADAIALWKNGEKHWLVPNSIEAAPYVLALAGLEPVQRGRIAQLAVDMGSIFRQGITITPPFIIRNAIRGAVSTGLMTSGQNLTLANNTLTGFADAINNGASTRAFKAESGMGDFRFGNPDVGFGKNDILIDFGMAPKTVPYRLRKLMDLAEAVGTASELADRVAARDQMIKNGMRPDEASYQALTVMNYARRGGSATLRQWLPMVPFLNARLQGLSRLAEGAVGKRGATGRRQALWQLAINGSLLALASGAIWGWNWSDEERREKYAGEPLYRRLGYHIIYIGDRTVLIPKAFELGHIFSSLPELFLDSMVGDMEGELGKGALKMVVDTVAFNAIPAAAQPLLEQMTNYSFFRQAPIEGMREASLLPEDRVTNADDLSIFLGRTVGLSRLPEAFGINAPGPSPARIEHAMQGHAGAYWVLASNLFSVVAQDLDLIPGIDKPLAAKQADNTFGTVPIVSNVLSRMLGWAVKDTDLQTTRFVEELYRSSDKATQQYRSAREAALNGNAERLARILDRYPAGPAQYRAAQQATTRMSDINRQIRMLRTNTSLSAKERRDQMVPLIQTRNEMAKLITRVLDEIEDATPGAP